MVDGHEDPMTAGGPGGPRPAAVADQRQPVNEEFRELLHRLKRIEGQARGIQRMILEGRSCEEIVIQLAALKEATTKVGMQVIGRHLERCLRDELAGEGTGQQAIEDIMRILTKLS